MEQEVSEEFLNQLSFEDNLLTTVVQDYENNRVLMLAYMNKEALKRTIKEKKAHYWSREREELWMKGEESGNVQFVKEIRFDCDGDALLLKVKQEKAACHKGYFTCFFREYKNGEISIVEEKVFEPKEVYGDQL